MSGYKVLPSAGGGGVVVGGDADIVWTETPHYRDVLTPKPKLPDTLHALDIVSNVKPAIPDVPHYRDSFSAIANVFSTKSDTLHLPEITKGSVIISDVGRSGTPDADFMGDAWIDETAAGVPAPNGINHGNETALQVGGALLAPTSKAAHLKWNLSRFVGFSAPTGGVMTVRLWVDASTVAVAQTVRFAFSQTAGSPFTESTINGSNNPAAGANVVTKTVAALLRVDPLVAEYRLYEMTFTAAEYGPWLGKFLMCFIDSDTLIATPYQVASREHVAGTDGGQRPYLAFDFQR